MASARDPSKEIIGRFVGRAEDFGFQAPPVPLRLKLLPAGACWTLFLQSGPEVHPARIVEWLPTPGLLRIEFGSRSVMRADYKPLPAAWASAFHGVELQVARLEPGGEVSVTVTGTRAGLAAYARRLYGPTAPIELVELHSVHPPVSFLTLPQDEALRTAVAAGYYRIPRTLNLDQLAKKLGITSASLSERLRRAEGRIITRYTDAGSASPWDEETLFDQVPTDLASVVWPEATPQETLKPKGKRGMVE